jgi:hypothetical protein
MPQPLVRSLRLPSLVALALVHLSGATPAPVRAGVPTFLDFVGNGVSGPGRSGRPGGSGRFGRGGPGGPGGPSELAIVSRFDGDGDKRLNVTERRAAREFMESQPRGGRNRMPVTAEAGPALRPAAVRPVPASVPLYDLGTLRTLFLDFDHGDWDAELSAFNNTDVEVPATLRVDGQVYRDVGVHYRGASSFSMVPPGLKRSLNVSVDFTREQTVGGYRTLNLLNAHEDPSLLRSVLYLQAARDYLPAPKANFVRVVINGESWGVYTSAQQFNKDFIAEWFGTTDGARWKVPGRPNGRGGLEYLGDDVAAYRRLYEIKSKDEPEAWAALVELCRVLNETPTGRLEAAIAPLLDIDRALRFLALDVTLVNNDGYWTRASDYSLYRATDGRFHVIPHDANETLSEGRTGRGGPSGGPLLDPLVGLNDPTKPLRSRLLAVPALQARYLRYVREIAAKWLDWSTLGPVVVKHRALIEADVRTDTHKLDSNEAFERSVGELKSFVDRRRAYLLGSVPH